MAVHEQAAEEMGLLGEVSGDDSDEGDHRPAGAGEEQMAAQPHNVREISRGLGVDNFAVLTRSNSPDSAELSWGSEVFSRGEDTLHNRRSRRLAGGGKWEAVDTGVGEEEFEEARAAKAGSDLRAKGADFVTVDWGYYEQKERDRKRRFTRTVAGLAWTQQQLMNCLEHGQSWVALLCIGFTTGAIASAIGIGCDWFSEVRYGLCTGKGFWVGRYQCCGLPRPRLVFRETHCPSCPPACQPACQPSLAACWAGSAPSLFPER